MTDEIVMYLIARQDLGMSPGKLAAQVGHGVQLAMRAAERCSPEMAAQLRRWEASSYAKIVLGVPDLPALDVVAGEVWKAGFEFVRVVDEGRTEIARATTCIALVPMPKSRAAPVVGKLRLYK
jgi:peptidyl-tRNA hydrolase, PTH2 family